jgi:hypothetical protein
MLLQSVPGLACDKNIFATMVRLYTGDDALADRVRDAGITPWTLCQAVPLVDADGAALLRTHKSLLCAAAGVPALPHRAPLAPAECDESPAVVSGLRPASYLRGKRLRVSRTSAVPHFRRISDECVACNGCAAAMTVHTDGELAARAFAPAWHELHWKTFLCERCIERARTVDTARADVCRSCYGARGAVATEIPLRYARADDAAQPRMLPLCAACAVEPCVRAQIGTVRFDGAVTT